MNGMGNGKGYPRSDCWPCMAKSSFYGNMGQGFGELVKPLCWQIKRRRGLRGKLRAEDCQISAQNVNFVQYNYNGVVVLKSYFRRWFYQLAFTFTRDGERGLCLSVRWIRRMKARCQWAVIRLSTLEPRGLRGGGGNERSTAPCEVYGPPECGAFKGNVTASWEVWKSIFDKRNTKSSYEKNSKAESQSPMKEIFELLTTIIRFLRWKHHSICTFWRKMFTFFNT